jgi:signal transduction histidine kinase
MKIPFCFIAALLLCTGSFSQSKKSKVDSLLLALKNPHHDTAEIKIYRDLASAYYSRNTDSFFIFCHRGLELAKKLDRKKDICVFDQKMSAMLTDTGNYTLSLKFAQEGLAIAQGLDSKIAIITSYCAIGSIYDYQSDFVKSSEYFFKGMAIAQEINSHEKIALMGTNLAASALNQGDYQKTEKYCFITLKEAQLAGAPIHTFKALEIMGVLKATLKDTGAAEDYYRKAIDVCRKNGFILNEATMVSDLADLRKDDKKKIDLLMQARQIYDSLSPASFDSRINWEELGQTYLKLFKSNQTETSYLLKAEEYLTKLISKSRESNDLMSVAQGLQSMATAEVLKKNYQLAYEYSNEFHTINDSIFSQDNKNKIAGLESKREIDLKNKEIENKELQLSSQRKQKIFFISGIFLLAVIGGLLYWQNITSKKTNTTLLQLNTELDDANKVKSIFFGILSHDLRSPVANLINFLELQKRKPGMLSEQQVADRENKIARAAGSLLDTMEAMLLWSKGQMEHFKPRIAAVPVNDLFEYLQKFFLGTENISFSYINEGNLVIRTDKDYLQTIMQNLTANAVKALQHTNGAQLAWKAWQENNKTFLSITDNGPGASDQQLKALYDDTASSSSRHGLGLHIIRDLAKAIDCTVMLQPQTKTGTVFILDLL